MGRLNNVAKLNVGWELTNESVRMLLMTSLLERDERSGVMNFDWMNEG